VKPGVVLAQLAIRASVSNRQHLVLTAPQWRQSGKAGIDAAVQLERAIGAMPKENTMSATIEARRPSPPDITARKGSAPLVMLTAYTTPIARLVDPHCDMVLVGDSVGMVLHGLPSTLQVTLEMMLMHGQAVARGLTKTMMIIDMPFGTYEEGREQAFRNAARLMQETGAAAVKLEGGEHMAETIAFLTQRGIPVMGHVGLTPQAVNTLGGYRVQGRGNDSGRVRNDAVAVAEAGAFSVVLEKVPDGLAGEITRAVAIPTIGIGASADCDGQVLVVDDMLGLFTAFKPKFVKRYADLGAEADRAIAAYAAEVRARRFPAAEHVFGEEPPRK
jgi:3-methyl-2-oxobutanoate hydroxymethyltransferase